MCTELFHLDYNDRALTYLYIINKILFEEGKLDGKQCIRRIEEFKTLLQKEYSLNNSPIGQDAIAPTPFNWQPSPHDALKYNFDAVWKHGINAIGFVVSDHSGNI